MSAICSCGDTLGDVDPRCAVHFPPHVVPVSRHEVEMLRYELLSAEHDEGNHYVTVRSVVKSLDKILGLA